MNGNEIVVVPANMVNNTITNHTYTINEYGRDVESFQMKIPTNQTVYPMPASNSQLTFNIPCGSFAIDIQNSNVVMNMMMTYHFAESTLNTSSGVVHRAWLQNTQWLQQDYTLGTAGVTKLGNPYRVSTGIVSPIQTLFLTNTNCGGVQSNTQRVWERLWKYIIKQSGDSCHTDQATFFMDQDNSYENAAISFDGIPYKMAAGTRTPIYCGTKGATTWSAGLDQANIAPEFTVNFSSDTTVDYCVTKNFTFRLPIQYLNDAFALTKNPLMYINAVRQQSMQLDLQFREFSFAKLFGYEIPNLPTGSVAGAATSKLNGLCDTVAVTTSAAGKFQSPFLNQSAVSTAGANNTTNSYTACNYATTCTQIQLWLNCKKSSLLNSDISSFDVVCEQLENIGWQAMNAPTQAGYSFEQPKQLKSVHELMYTTSPKDQDKPDSLYAHGLCGKQFAHDIVNAWNGDMSVENPNACQPNAPGPLTQQPVPEFYDINLSLPGGQYDYVRGIGGIENLSQLKNITLQSQHLLGCPFSGACPLFVDYLWKTVASVFIVDVEKFKGKMHGMGDTIINDGIDTTAGQVIFRYNYIALYDPSAQAGNGQKAPDACAVGVGQTTAMPYAYKGMPALNFSCYYANEQFLVIEPMKSAIHITNNIRPYLNRMMEQQ